MHIHAVVAPLALATALAGPAAAGEGYWASIFHDLVSGPARTSDFQWQGRVAPGRTIEIKGVNGSIQAIGSSGDEVPAGVRLLARTVNGAVDASGLSADADAETVNGSIRVSLPKAASTTVDAETVNGSIVSDFSVSGGTVTRRRLKGTIGGGGRAMSLETVNGSIHLGHSGP